MKLGILGGGNMGEALLESLLSSRLFQASEVMVVEIDQGKQDHLSSTYHIEVSGDISQLTTCSMLVLAIKPQDFDKVDLTLTDNSIVLSILAGIPTDKLKAAFPNCRVVRCMPNLGLSVGLGMTGIYIRDKENFVDSETKLIRQFFRASGRVLEVDEESQLDKITAISGTGPAYFYYFVEQLIASAVSFGFSQQDAELLVRQTLYGATETLKQNEDDSAAIWRQKVTSAKGTTEKAIDFLENSNFQELILGALKAAEQRSRELGEQA